MGRFPLTLGRTGGWILVEVLAAMTVLALVVGPLAAGVVAMLDRGTDVQKQANAIATATPTGDDAWSWGAQAVSAQWNVGPTLQVRVNASDLIEGALVGVWAEGWLVCEAAAPEDGLLSLGASGWSSRCGDELVIRVRRDGEAWGPPWRTLVPDVSGVIAAPAADEALAAATGDAAVHEPVAAESPCRFVPDVEGTMEDSPSGLPSLATSLVPGFVGVEWGAAEQHWLCDPERSVDVYF